MASYVTEIFRNKKADVLRPKGKGREENWEEGWFRQECLSNHPTAPGAGQLSPGATRMTVNQKFFSYDYFTVSSSPTPSTKSLPPKKDL